MDLSGIDGKIPTKRNIGRTVLNMDILMIVMMMMTMETVMLLVMLAMIRRKKKLLAGLREKEPNVENNNTLHRGGVLYT